MSPFDLSNKVNEVSSKAERLREEMLSLDRQLQMLIDEATTRMEAAIKAARDAYGKEVAGIHEQRTLLRKAAEGERLPT